MDEQTSSSAQNPSDPTEQRREDIYDTFFQEKIEGSWDAMYKMYQENFPQSYDEETFEDHMNTAARMFHPDFLMALFGLTINIVGRRVSDHPPESIYFDVNNDDAKIGKEFIDLIGQKRFRHEFAGPMVFLSLAFYRDLYTLLQKEKGEDPDKMQFHSTVFRGMMFALERAYDTFVLKDISHEFSSLPVKKEKKKRNSRKKNLET